MSFYSDKQKELWDQTKNKFSNKVFGRNLQVIISIGIIAVIFFAGYYVGTAKYRNVVRGMEDAKLKNANLDPFWQVWDVLNEKFSPASTTTDPVSADKKVYGAVAGLAAAYGDPYTVFFPPVESKMFNEEISGSFGGVGMEIEIQDGNLTVVAPVKGSPAEKAGVQAGDKIVKIGDKPAANMPTEDAVKLIRGDIGTSVDVTFARKGVADLIVKKLTRQAIDIPTIATVRRPGGVFIISLYSFSAVSPQLFRNALREFIKSGDDKLILDLRNNPGGYLEAALDMASYFLPAGKTVVTENYGEKQDPDVYRSKGYDVFNDNLKFVILVNGGSASASEILAGALREHGKAVLIGEDTFGKGSVQELIPITDDTSLKVTVAHWFTPNGISISKGGLKPDIISTETLEDAKNKIDTALERAVKYLIEGK